jgi:hypothetical protein
MVVVDRVLNHGWSVGGVKFLLPALPYLFLSLFIFVVRYVFLYVVYVGCEGGPFILFLLCMRAARAAQLYCICVCGLHGRPNYAVFEGRPGFWFPAWDGPGGLLRASRAVISVLVFTVRTRADQVSFPGKDLGLLPWLVGHIMLCGWGSLGYITRLPIGSMGYCTRLLMVPMI